MTGQVISVSNQDWAALVVHQAPLNKDCEKSADPDTECEFLIIDTPVEWMSPAFDDNGWPAATEWSAADVSPKDGYGQVAWDAAAHLIWGADLETDNTILLRSTIAAADGD